MVVVQYANQVNQYSSLNLTKLDVLDDLDEIKIGVAYEIDGKRLPLGAMPSTLDDLESVEVVYETMPGWKTSIAHCRDFEELPAEARAYVRRIEKLAGCPVTWIGVGPGREDMATKGFSA
jgi:adenylosuccinate synthase